MQIAHAENRGFVLWVSRLEVDLMHTGVSAAMHTAHIWHAMLSKLLCFITGPRTTREHLTVQVCVRDGQGPNLYRHSAR